jgi:hypothetical protein
MTSNINSAIPALFYGSLLFGLSFLLQLIMWRISLPKRQTKSLLLLFFAVFFCGSLILNKFVTAITIFGIHPPASLPEYFQMWLYLVSLTLAYMITYSAIEVDSPSLLIIMKISEAEPIGLTKKQLKLGLGDDVLIKPRIDDMLLDRMAELKQGRYRLTRKGILLAQLFIFYRNLMRASRGG